MYTSPHDDESKLTTLEVISHYVVSCTPHHRVNQTHNFRGDITLGGIMYTSPHGESKFTTLVVISH